MTPKEKLLQNSITMQEKTAGKAVGLNGSYHISSADGAVTGLALYAFVPAEDTTLTVCSGKDNNENAIDFLVTMNLTSKTLKAGSYFSVPPGYRITAITASAGSLVGYKL